jgi:hypothetical protein
MRVNVVNVCTPTDSEKKELENALARVPERPVFSPDFEVARGRTTDKKVTSDWVRLRRELASDPSYGSVQFSLTISGPHIEEVLVLHAKATRPGEPLQISLEEEVTTGKAADALSAGTPPDRIRLERFGKPSLILARCSQADQQAYEPLFRIATERFSVFRAALDVHSTVSAELARLKAAPAKRR